MNSDVQPHTPSEPGTSAASPVNQNPTGVTWEANLPSAREFVKERIDHVLSQLLPESRVGAQLFEALHSVKGFSSADAQHQIRGLLISVLRADATLETFAQNIARRPDDADKITLAVLLQQRSVKETLKPYVQESLGSTAKPELINQKAAEVQRVLVEASKAIKIVEVSVAQEVSRPQRFEAGLKAFNNSPFFVHGLSQERMQPMLNSDTPAQASMFGLGCVTSVGVGGGIALEVLGMYFRQALFNRMFEIPKAVVVIARNIAQASAHVETDNAEHKRQLDRILDWHLVVASRIREFDPSFEVITDIELERSAAWEQAAATRANIEGLPHVNRYSVRQDITVEATRLAYGATVKGGWTTWEADSPIEYERLLVRPGMPEAGSCEGGFDHYSMQAYPGAMSYFYGPAAYSFKSNEETACPYVAPPNVDGTREGRIPLHILAADDVGIVIPRPEEIVDNPRHFRRYLHALDRLVSIFTLAQAFDARLVPQGIARQFESVAALGTEVRRLRERCDLMSGSDRDAALKQFSDARFEHARAQREVLLAQLPYLIGRFGYIK